MKIDQLKCPNCGADLVRQEGSNVLSCEYCRTVFQIDSVEQNSYEKEIGRLRAQQEMENQQKKYEEQQREYEAQQRRQTAAEEMIKKKATNALIYSIIPCCGIFQILGLIMAIQVLRAKEASQRDRTYAFVSIAIVGIYIMIYIVNGISGAAGQIQESLQS